MHLMTSSRSRAWITAMRRRALHGFAEPVTVGELVGEPWPAPQSLAPVLLSFMNGSSTKWYEAAANIPVSNRF